MTKMSNIDMPCNVCGKMIFLTVKLADRVKYEKTGNLKDAFPDLTDKQREYIYSGICEKCQPKVFK